MKAWISFEIFRISASEYLLDVFMSRPGGSNRAPNVGICDLTSNVVPRLGSDCDVGIAWRGSRLDVPVRVILLDEFPFKGVRM